MAAAEEKEGSKMKRRTEKNGQQPQPLVGHAGELSYEDGKVAVTIDGHRIAYCVGYGVDHTPSGQPILVVRVLLKTLNRNPLIAVPARSGVPVAG